MTDYEIRGIAHSVNSDWWYDDHDLLQFSRALLARAAPQPAEQEPVAWMYFDSDGDAIFGHPNGYRPDDAVPVYTTPQLVIPPGYKLVPVEPTREMLNAGVEDLRLRGLPLGLIVAASECYRAMLAAAPKAPQPKAEPDHKDLLIEQLEETNLWQAARIAELMAEQKPVAHENSNGVVHAAGYPWSDKEVLRPLVYGDTSQKPVKREPLTDEDIQDLLKVGNPTEDEYRLIRMGWNAAHGIGGQV